MHRLNRKDAITILESYIELKLSKLKWYQQIASHIKAIVFYGSTAKGLNRADSDLDILIFVPLSIELKYTKGEYFYHYNDREINIVMRSIERLRKLAKEKNNSIESEVFRKCKILSQSDSEVKTLIKKIRTAKN